MLTNKNIDYGKAFDWRLTSDAYAKYRDIYPQELYSRLRGTFIKVYLTYTLYDEIASASHTLVKKMNKTWTPSASESKDMFDDLFEGRVTETFYCDIPFTRESWHGRMCACRGTLASMDMNTFMKCEERHKAFLEKCPEEFTIKHKLYISYFIL